MTARVLFTSKEADQGQDINISKTNKKLELSLTVERKILMTGKAD